MDIFLGKVGLHSRPARLVSVPFWLAAVLFSPLLYAQATSNLAPAISFGDLSGPVRADTFCVLIAVGEDLAFDGLVVADGDVGAGMMHARVELEQGAASDATVFIPGLAALPDIDIIREEDDRIRFDAPLSTVNAAFAALEYRSAGAGDTIDLIANDLQLPSLSAEFRLHIDAQPGAETEFERCRPPPDLRAESDSGDSSSDDITSAPTLTFDVGGLDPGDVVQLLNDDELVSEAIAEGVSLVMTDPSPVVGATALYAVSVNGDAGSAAWSVAVVETTLFNLSGTVSGLAGSGLVLQNFGADDLPISGDGVFTFSSPLADGAFYSVGVLNQPTGPQQDCTVEQGTGQVGGANVTHVMVTCVTDTFTIGGIVKGLVGSGLVLQNNGGDDLSIPTDGEFSFDTALADGTDYEVTVLAHPSVPRQFCSVKQGSGTLAGSNVNNVDVLCVLEPFTLVVIGGSGQSAFFDEPFANLLVARLLDANDAAVVDVDVVFVAPSAGASALLSDGVQPPANELIVRTDGNGVAVVVAIANSSAGCYVVEATSEGSPDVAVFVLTNVNPDPLIFADGFETDLLVPSGVTNCEP